MFKAHSKGSSAWCEVKRFAMDSTRTGERRHVFLSIPPLTTLHHGSCRRVWLRINLEPWRNSFMQWIGWIWRRAVAAVFGPVCTTPRNVKGWWGAWMILNDICVTERFWKENWIVNFGTLHPWEISIYIPSAIHSNKQQAKKVWSSSTAFRREVKPSNS